jgi:formylglycine-generating enzyme required for sulfatase activity
MRKAKWGGLIGRVVMMGLAWSSLSATAMSANDVGNGGGAWVCRDNAGAIQWSRLVDLFEAESEFGLTLAQYQGQVRDIVDQVELRIFRTDRDLYEALAPYLEKVVYLEPNPPKVTYTEDALQIIDDSLYRLTPSSRRCVGGTIKYEQVVNYKNDGLILLQSEVFNSFSNSVKAALVLHEAVYAYRREVSGDANSVNARRIVGLIFSTLSNDELKKALESLGESETGAVGAKFVPISPGSFLMGSPKSELDRDAADERQHLVQIRDGFEIQTTEVTQAQWVEVMGNNPSEFQKRENCPKTYRVVKSIPMCPSHPVEQVSWTDVQTFLSKLNGAHRDTYFYRLPTEAEWEYAARAGTETAYSFGNNPNQLFHYGYYFANSGKQTHAVGELKSNGLGLYDMHGNVFEWVEDWYSSDFGQPEPWWDRSYSRVFRGGGWQMVAASLRSAARSGAHPDYRAHEVGFRLVRNR